MPFLDKLSAWSATERSQTFNAVFTIASAGLALGLRFALTPVLPPGFPYLTFFPAVILTGFVCGTRWGTIQGVICGLASWFFFIDPQHSFGLPFGAVVALIFYVFVIGTDLFLIEVMRRALVRMRHSADRAAALAETNALMFHELQHRVSNNLAVVAALLKLQRRNVADPAAATALDQASSRVEVVGKVQRLLHDPNKQEIDLSRFLVDLVPQVVDTAGLTDRADIRMNTRPLRISPDQSVPLALVCAELVANAVEHGAGDAGGLRLDVRCAPTGDGQAEVEIADAGRGLPEGFRLDQATSLGLRIARQFALQLGGSLTLDNRGDGQGTRARVTFPLAA